MQRQLNLVFAGELEDPLLSGLYVVHVHAPAGGSTLVVELVTEDAQRVPLPRLLARLAAARPRLRAEIAQAISRKRTPWLEFRVAPSRAPDVTDTREEVDRETQQE
ncbi:MAG: hypothetical protein H6713_14185 [Myxococcales bacterium]|nr:hypothetical protein [Myxococcales bacterium]